MSKQYRVILRVEAVLTADEVLEATKEFPLLSVKDAISNMTRESIEAAKQNGEYHTNDVVNFDVIEEEVSQ